MESKSFIQYFLEESRFRSLGEALALAQRAIFLGFIRTLSDLRNYHTGCRVFARSGMIYASETTLYIYARCAVVPKAGGLGFAVVLFLLAMFALVALAATVYEVEIIFVNSENKSGQRLAVAV